MEVQGYGDAAKWVYGEAIHPGDLAGGDLITLQEVRHIHHLCMTPVWTVAPHPHATDREGPGNFREHEIATFPGGMKPPTWPDIDALMRTWVTKVDDLRTPPTPLPEALAEAHNEFERIHPFLDGNGRTGRLVLNLLLGRLGYPPAIIFKRDRERYLLAMRKADQGEFGPLGELIARSVTANLYKFVMPAVAGPVKLVPLAALATPDLSENALRVAASRNRLQAVKGDDGHWRSSKKWVAEYRKTRHQRSK
nr:Fic family protein [Actinokineospora terrae]